MFDLNLPNHLIQISQQLTPNIQINTHHHSQNQFQNQFKQKMAISHQQTSMNKGKWTLREIMRYYLFLIEFSYFFKSKQLRKSMRIFSLMSKHIKSRGTAQCKSHHQKINNIYKGIDRIIAHYNKQLLPLRAQWKEFIRTQDRVVINSFDVINSGQDYYQILQLKNSIRIYINEEMIQTYNY